MKVLVVLSFNVIVILQFFNEAFSILLNIKEKSCFVNTKVDKFFLENDQMRIKKAMGRQNNLPSTRDAFRRDQCFNNQKS